MTTKSVKVKLPEPVAASKAQSLELPPLLPKENQKFLTWLAMYSPLRVDR